MPVTKKYSLDDINQILQQSEGRQSPVSHEPGHALNLHVGVSGHGISDRLLNTVQTDATHPLILDAQGAIASEATHRNTWKNRNPGMTTQDSKNDYRQMIANSKSRSGAFLDRRQAIAVAKHMLNSSEGQAKLQELDGGQDRVALKLSLSQLELSWQDAWKMSYAEQAGGANSDITHQTDFSQAFMLIDKLDANNIHVQTLYPIE